MPSPGDGLCCWENSTTVSITQTSFSNESYNTRTDSSIQTVAYSDTVLLVVTILLGTNIAVSLFLNILLVLIIQYSPSLRTPPNSHLLNICINNLLLCLDMVLCVLCMHFNNVKIQAQKSEFLSGLQLFFTYNSLLQYWGTFASIGFYRHRTIKKPGLTLRSRRQLVSRCVTCNWVISSLLSMTLSLSYSQSSRYALSTLDPFMRDFFASKNHKPSQEEHVTVTLVILVAFSVGLAMILTAYYSICRTLNVVSALGRNRISPRHPSPNIHSDSSDLTMSMARSYRPQYTLSSAPSYLGGTLSRDHKDTFIVSYNKNENSVTVDDLNNSDSKVVKTHLTTNSRNMPRSAYGQRRQLSATLSNASTCSVKSKVPEFTDISIGADLLRFQRQQNHTLQQRRPSFRRESISLSSAIRNSLAMLIAYCTCSLPLIVFSVPEPAWKLSPLQRLQVLLFCRLLFYLNAPVYPLWYLLFSVTVKKCFTRLWEGVVGRWRGRQ